MDTKQIKKILHELIERMDDKQLSRLSISSRGFWESDLAFLFNFIILFHDHIPLIIWNTVKQF